MPSIINAAFLLSAWSAASADIYISSRYLYLLAKRSHAPKIFGILYLRKPDVQKPALNNRVHHVELKDLASPTTSPTSGNAFLQPVGHARRDSFDHAIPIETAAEIPQPSPKSEHKLDPRDRATPWGVRFHYSVVSQSSSQKVTTGNSRGGSRRFVIILGVKRCQSSAFPFHLLIPQSIVTAFHRHRLTS